MKTVVRWVAVLAVLCLAVLSGSTAATAATAPDRVGDLRAKAMKVRIDTGSATRWKEIKPDTKVFLRDASGNRRAGDLDDLTRGARVVKKNLDNGVLRSITLQERGATGAADCSFDSDEDDGDEVSTDDSFDCSNDYDDGTVDTDSDCSYDSSRDGPDNDWSMDASWDCSYSETDDRDDDGGLDWDCSYSASAGGYSDVDGGDTDADLDFDCSWSGAGTDVALWDCRFLPGVLGFRCVSAELGQELAYTIDVETMEFVGGMDFQTDRFDDDTAEGDGVGCTGSAADGYDCSVDGEAGPGDCAVGWSFDKSAGTREGDVSGSLSYSCSWDA